MRAHRDILAFALLLVLATTCGGGPANKAPAEDPRTLRHYEVRADQLPKPFATRDGVNTPALRPEHVGVLQVPPGFSIALFADGFSQPRNMLVLPNGDVLVADAGHDEIVLLRDANGDGKPEVRANLIDGVDRIFGLAFGANFLYLGEGSAVARVAFTPGQTSITASPQKIMNLPRGGHWTRNISLSPDGTKLYVAVGSESNVGTGEPPIRAAISELDLATMKSRVFASGLRNPVGLAWNPATKRLWTAVNERDGLGDNLPPDYITEVVDGAFYGWPYAYTGAHEDPRHRGDRADLVKRTRVPDVLLQAHSAPLGVAFYTGSTFPADFHGDAFVALHGSWNRSEPTGYKVVRVPFTNGRPAGGYDDFVTGFYERSPRELLWGRPVGLAVMKDGSLLVSEDAAGRIWRVTYRK